MPDRGSAICAIHLAGTVFGIEFALCAAPSSFSHFKRNAIPSSTQEFLYSLFFYYLYRLRYKFALLLSKAMYLWRRMRRAWRKRDGNASEAIELAVEVLNCDCGYLSIIYELRSLFILYSFLLVLVVRSFVASEDFNMFVNRWVSERRTFGLEPE